MPETPQRKPKSPLCPSFREPVTLPAPAPAPLMFRSEAIHTRYPWKQQAIRSGGMERAELISVPMYSPSSEGWQQGARDVATYPVIRGSMASIHRFFDGLCILLPSTRRKNGLCKGAAAKEQLPGLCQGSEKICMVTFMSSCTCKGGSSLDEGSLLLQQHQPLLQL
ncbi:uncharacterized protein FYW23_005938 isoform 2-T10 [Sylvia borin]